MTSFLKMPKLVGMVTHYYGRPHVAVIKCADDIPLGTHVQFIGATTDFEEDIDSMEYEHHPIIFAKQGEEIGIKVEQRVREGDRVYIAV